MRTLRIDLALTTLMRMALGVLCFLLGSHLRAEVSNYEKQIIASVLVLEAANQGEEGMLAVLHVINNRAGGNPERAVGKVARRKAFSCLNTITSQAHPDYGPAIARAMKDRTWEQALQMVDNYCAGRLGYDFTGGATHYCIDPPQSWHEQMAFTKRIGSHVFFREG
jgi:spore germination cell wall hydrolase CwlJ-like protein